MTEDKNGYVATGKYSPNSRSFRYTITRPDGTLVKYWPVDGWGTTEYFWVWGWESRVRRKMRKEMAKWQKYDEAVANPRYLTETI